MARTVLPRLQVGSRECISHEEYRIHALRGQIGLAIVVITDEDYPSRVAFRCIASVAEDFQNCISEHEWRNAKGDDSIDYKERLKKYLKKFDDPESFDSVVKTQRKVDETKEIMQKNIEQVLAGGENLEQLMMKSEDVSDQTKAMFQSSKKLKKKCCVVQ
eukprot:Polyplicarium_translucidae@DN2433_c0_g1_i4.p2